MNKVIKNPLGAYEVEVKGKRYTIRTDHPDFKMDYQENFQTKKRAAFCCLSHEPVPMPRRKGDTGPQEYGYMCAAVSHVSRHDTFPVYVVQKRKIHMKSIGGEKYHKFVYLYGRLDNSKDRDQGKVIRKLVV